ncbi:hypothetical protein D7V93_26145 [Corallococcus llansteffanensis]|uniref:Transposase IS66 zinc-finger binding domain-containing protein n=1 Tax=Corallococcus llansteffanensis TaxID=2316731 RepID=A0A3A8PBX3_9BACT|nr:hypothetical protein D7V93_26145 [Corallococcus llansteffanensis]
MRIEHVTDLETAKQMAALLEAENARLHQRLELLVQENARLKGEDAQARLQLELTQLAEQLALMQQRLFGASSEKRKPAVEATPPASARKQRGHGPRAQPQLPVQEVVLPLDEADKVCGLCGGALKEWAGQTEDSQEVSVVERHFVLKHYRRQKYRCPCGCAPVTAPAPPRLIGGWLRRLPDGDEAWSGWASLLLPGVLLGPRATQIRGGRESGPRVRRGAVAHWPAVCP